MRFGILRAVAVLSLLLITPLFHAEAVWGQTPTQSADEVLAAATKASLNAGYKAALRKSQEAKSLANGDLSFSVRYISAVTSMADPSHRQRS